MNNLENTVNYITRKSGKEIEKLIPRLKLSGIGGSMKDNIINFKKLVFKHRGTLDKDESVLLLEKIVDVYLSNIYSEKRMIDYLQNHSFTYKNLQIVFIIYDDMGNDVFHPDLSYISLIEGIITYESLRITENEIYKVETINEEPYEDAAKRLGIWKNQPEETSENS
ncbi:MAG: hypothetical protein Tsb0021_18440 [Chlamydiales bacterium]